MEGVTGSSWNIQILVLVSVMMILMMVMMINSDYGGFKGEVQVPVTSLQCSGQLQAETHNTAQVGVKISAF